MLVKPTPISARARRAYRFDIKRMAADCEANYLRLCRLLPGIAAQDGTQHWPVGDKRQLVMRAGNAEASLDLQVAELCRYTTMLELTLQMAALSATKVAAALPIKMQVRLYHDARLAEVVTVSGQRSALARYSYPNDSMFQPDEKAQQNRFLAEWLGKCLRYGHARDLHASGVLALGANL